MHFSLQKSFIPILHRVQGKSAWTPSNEIGTVRSHYQRYSSYAQFCEQAKNRRSSRCWLIRIRLPLWTKKQESCSWKTIRHTVPTQDYSPKSMLSGQGLSSSRLNPNHHVRLQKRPRIHPPPRLSCPHRLKTLSSQSQNKRFCYLASEWKGQKQKTTKIGQQREQVSVEQVKVTSGDYEIVWGPIWNTYGTMRE